MAKDRKHMKGGANYQSPQEEAHMRGGRRSVED